MSFFDTFTGFLHVPSSDYASNIGWGLLRTLAYTVASFVGAAILGLVLALMRLNQLRLVRLPAALYTEVFKNVPLLAIIFVAGVLSLIFFYAAYLSEIFRAAVGGIHSGQNEAAQALGLGRGTTFGHVVLPQALRLALSFRLCGGDWQERGRLS